MPIDTPSTVEISREDAYAIRRLLADIMDIDSRARCSDRFFRSHFTDYLKVMRAAGTIQHLDNALNADNTPQ